MEPNNFVDNLPGLGYNEPNDVNEAIVEHYLSQPQIVKMDEQAPVNDTKCRHETLVPDPSDKLDSGAIYHGCANAKCGLGFYILVNEENK